MAFVPEAALIALREGLEALLITGILLGLVLKLGRPDARKWVWSGFALGALASIAVGLLVQWFLLDRFESSGGAEWFELVAALVAVAVLTYMVFWMWKHTRTLMAGLRKQVESALSRNTLWIIAFLTFAAVVREGLEVVLFYGALAGRSSAMDLVWSGALGLVASAAIVFAILRTSMHFDLARFFAITGILLVFIAGGLLVHSVHAATDLGILAHQPSLWDTSAAIPDDRADGRILHALFGYTAAPTLLQALLYFGYIFGVGITYLASLGGFRRTDKSIRKGAVTAVVALVWLASVATTFGAANPGPAANGHHEDGDAYAYGADHGVMWADAIKAVQGYDGTIGILIRDHGEIESYNASTYESIKEFVRHVWTYSGLPPEVLTVDTGSYFLDRKHLFDPAPHTDPELVDPWVQPWALPAAPVRDLPETGAFCGLTPEDQLYYVPGAGPGLGEPDFFEWCGLGALIDWTKMNNYSPRQSQGLASWHYLETHLYKHFGAQVVVAFAHGHDTKANANHTLDAAARYLVSRRATVVLDAYQSSVFSDAMNTCMMAPHAEHALHEAGFRGEIIPVGMAGLNPAWGNATATYAAHLLETSPVETKVSIHLTQHGSRPGSRNPCGSGPDQYHENLRKQYEVVSATVAEKLATRGHVTLRHVYGAGAGAPDDGVLSPMEALALDEAEGIQQTIIIPYEFWGDAVDNLVYLRENLGFEPEQAPYYDVNHETRFTYRGIGVLVASAFFETETKSDAQLAQIAQELVRLVPQT